MLGRVEVLARWLLSVAAPLNGVIASSDASILDLDVGRRMGELAFGVWAGTLVPLELATHLELKPT